MKKFLKDLKLSGIGQDLECKFKADLDCTSKNVPFEVAQNEKFFHSKGTNWKPKK